jgi:hypothetical protein
MHVLGFIWRRLCKFWRGSGNVQTGIDSHKWESKFEVYRSLSKDRY